MSDETKIGTGHLTGMLRKGLTELAQYLPAFNSAGTSVNEDQAIWPNQTPGEIAQARGSFAAGPEQEPLVELTPAPAHDAGQIDPEVAAELQRMQGNEQSLSRGQ